MSMSLDALFNQVASNFGILGTNSNGNTQGVNSGESYLFDFGENTDVKNQSYDEFIEEYIEAAISLGYTREEAIKELEANDITVDSSEYDSSDDDSKEISANTSLKKTIAVDKSELPEEVQEMIEEIEGKLDKNDSEIKDLESKVKKLTEEAEKEIEEAVAKQDKLKDEYDEDSKDAVSSALEEYIAANKENPGSMDKSDLQELIKKGMPNKPDLAEVVASITAASDLLDEVDDCLEDINKLTQESKNLEAQISQLTTKQVTDCSQIASMLEEKGVTISDEEWNLAETNNLDLSEKMEDGSARYIFAQGQEDGEYHIYDMAQDGASLARLYGENNGYCIVENGNGYIRNYNESENGANTVYSLNDCGELVETQACYSTCSPLSFDLNGDGVKTSDKVIDYDIDGDGEVDKINDSADAVLVFDKDGDGISGADGSECFGNNTDLDGDGKADGFKDGFEALKALATDAGLINGKDDNVLDENDLAVLEKDYGLKMKANGYNSEAQSLADLGITEINLAQTDSTTLTDDFDGNGNQLMQQEGATFTINGETREYADIWHKKQDDEVENGEQSNLYSSGIQEHESFYDLYKNIVENLRNKIENIKNSLDSYTNIDELLEDDELKKYSDYFELLKPEDNEEKIA